MKVKKGAPFTISSFLMLLVLAVCIPAHEAGPEVAEMAPDFELKDAAGITYRLSDLKGQTVLINFWASWCRECLEEMPSLNALYLKLRKEGIVVLGISIDRNWKAVRGALEKTPVQYPVLLDSRGDVFVKKYTVIGIPTTIVVDSEGVIREKIIGRFDFGSASFIDRIQNLSSTGRQ